MNTMSKGEKAALCVLFLLALAGFCCWIYQQANGLGITGMSNGTSWGLYLCLFLLFVGLSAGGLIVAAAGSVFNIKDYEKVALPAVITSLSCILVAGALVLVDLGGIVRLWNMLATPNLSSPLVWDMTVITAYIVMNIIELVLLVSPKPTSKRKLRIASAIALPIAVLVHSVTAWILGLQVGREWFSSIMAPLFVVSAMDSGLALLLIVLLGLKKTRAFATPMRIVSKLSVLLAVVVALDFYFVGCEILSAAYPQEEHAIITLSEMISGSTAPAFWMEIVLLVAAFLLLVPKKNRQNAGLVFLASCMVVVSVLCKRIWLMFTSFIHPNIDFGPGVISGSYTARIGQGDEVWATTSNYIPQIPEIMIAIAVISLGAIVFIVLTHKLLPLYRASHESDIQEMEEETTAELSFATK